MLFWVLVILGALALFGFGWVLCVYIGNNVEQMLKGD